MAWLYRNTLDGVPGVAVTPENSLEHGGRIATATRLVYTDTWIAGGSAAVLIGESALTGVLETREIFGAPRIGVRVYGLLPAGSMILMPNVSFDDDWNEWVLGGTDIAHLRDQLVDQPWRYEVLRPLTGNGQATHRLFWGANVNGTVPDFETAGATTTAYTAVARVRAQGYSAVHAPIVDELVVTDGDWPGPVAWQGDVFVGGQVALQREDRPPLPPAENAAPEGMWIGPLGGMRPIEERATVKRAPDLGESAFISLEGRVTTSRTRAVARRVDWSWDRLRAEDRDWLAEVALLGRRDATVECLDPASRNLCTREQSRGAQAPGTVTAAGIYRVEGGGALGVGQTASGREVMIVTGGAEDAQIIWLHPYHGARGWPVLSGWPVHFAVENMGAAGVQAVCRLRLEFYGRDGALLGRAEAAPGAGSVSADAPSGAVTVSVRAVLPASPPSPLSIGGAYLGHTPPAAGPIPLGDGQPTLSISGWSEDIEWPYHSVSLGAVEVIANAAR